MTLSGLPEDGGRPIRSADVVVVIPGIMGTDLLDRASRRLVWGVKDPRWYARSWRDGGLDPLALTEAERAAVATDRYDPQTARIVPGGLLRFPVALPVLRGIEPYTALLMSLRSCVHEDAILEFGYDWRLPVSFNARLLAAAMRMKLQGWLRHPAYERAVRDGLADGHARIVIVAHSMGGLLAQHLSLIDGATADVRLIITLGTPFLGAVKAVELLNTGRGAPLPLRRSSLRRIAATLPGVHDLLPAYPCLLGMGQDGLECVLKPSAADLTEIGADPTLTALARHDHDARVDTGLIGHVAVLGTELPTTQSMTIRDGVVSPAYRTYHWHQDGELRRGAETQALWTDERGDGTVFRYAAAPRDLRPIPLVQSHGGLARASEALGMIRGLVTEQPWSGAKLGAGDIGVDIPDVVTPNESFEMVVSGEDDPGRVQVSIEQVGAERDRPMPAPSVARTFGMSGLRASVRFVEPGLYRVGAKTGGGDPVAQLVICEESDG